MQRTSGGRRISLVVAVVVLTAALDAPVAAASADDVDPRITAVMDKPAYEHAQWGLLRVDPLGTEDADRFRTALPVLGVDGSLGGFCTSCPARGRVFAKTGTVAGPDDLDARLLIGAMTLGGYLEVGDGRYEVFYVGVTGATATTIEQLVAVLGDVAAISAVLQENAAASTSPE